MCVEFYFWQYREQNWDLLPHIQTLNSSPIPPDWAVPLLDSGQLWAPIHGLQHKRGYNPKMETTCRKKHKSTLKLRLLTCLHKERAVASLWALKWLWERSGGPGGHRCPHSSGSPGSQGWCWDSQCTGDQEDQKDDPHASGRWKPLLFDLQRKHGRLLQTIDALGTLYEKK